MSNEASETGKIAIGHFQFTPALFVALMAAAAGVLFSISGYIGSTLVIEHNALAKQLLQPHVIWAILMVPLLFTGANVLAKSGYSTPSRMIKIMSAGFVFGALGSALFT